MSLISYIDDIFRLGYCHVKRDYSSIKDIVIQSKGDLNYAYEENGDVWGYKIAPNKPLRKLYGFDVWVVRFYFSNVDTLHNETQESIMNTLFSNLQQEMEKIPGYYNVRLPSHIVDALKGFNKNTKNAMFCGGTVEQIIYGKSISENFHEEIKIVWPTEEYIEKNKKILSNLTYTSFESYQGQYHISQSTDSKAGLIYENWIGGCFDNFKENTVIIVEYKERPIGFCIYEEGEFSVEGQLSAVDCSYRNYGGYKAMITTLINYAQAKGKSFIASTQFDNYISHGTWNKLGMKPFFSFYNFHFDHCKNDMEELRSGNKR
ncbi:MAG TPA: GNAT family N-acetyltransferase [Sedimentibacter sp.]|nr:GNAT family N-acetyltransferase [Sedimentibacter sp.]